MSSLLWAAEAALRTGAVSRARALYMDAFVAAQRPSLRAAALAGLGHTAFAAAEHREAATRFEHALSLAPDLLERDPAAADALGRAYSLLCRDRESIDLFRTRLQASERRGDTGESVRFALLLADAHADRGSLRRAARVLGHASALARGIPDEVVTARVHRTAARLHLLDGRVEQAEREARAALGILERADPDAPLAHARHLLAHVLLYRGEPVDALLLLEDGRSVLEANAYGEGLFLVEWARALDQLGRADEARAAAAEAFELLHETSATDAGRALVVVGGILRRRGDADAAVETYRRALALMPRPDRYRAEALAPLARLLEEQGRAADALELLDESLRLRAETPA